MKKIFLLVVSCLLILNLQANSFEKDIQGRWYMDISMPIEENIEINMKGSINYMFNKESISEIIVSFKTSQSSIEICSIIAMSKWQLSKNILLEEITDVRIIPNTAELKELPELQQFVDLMKLSFYPGLKDTSTIKSITKEKLIVESAGIEIIGVRKPNEVFDVRNNVN